MTTIDLNPFEECYLMEDGAPEGWTPVKDQAELEAEWTPQKKEPAELDTTYPGTKFLG